MAVSDGLQAPAGMARSIFGIYMYVFPAVKYHRQLTIVYCQVNESSSTLNAELIACVNEAHGVHDVNSVSWCPREGFEDLLATAGDDCSVKVWRIKKRM